MLIIHTHHHDEHSDPKYDPVYRCVLQELDVKFKGSIVGDATNYKVMKKIIIPDPADNGSYMEIMPESKHNPQFLVSQW